MHPKYNMYTFDIETGVSNKADPRAPTVFGGFVECICALSVICNKDGYDLTSQRLDVYCMRYEGCDTRQLEEKISQKLAKHALVANILVFTEESAMILSFLREAYWNCDYLIGYNSDSYDWTFLVNRYKVLTEGTQDVIDPENRWTRGVVSIVGAARMYDISCSNGVIFPASCCGKASQQTSEGYLCTKCKQIIVPTNLNLTCQLDNTPFTRAIMPFTLHYDIFKNSVLTGTLPNKQLNTLVGQTFALEIKKYFPLDTEPDSFSCSVTAVLGMQHLFLPNLVCHIVRANKTTKMQQILFDGVIVSLTGTQIVVKLTRKLCTVTDLCGLTITIGKTSSISSETQMRWTSVEDMVDTVAYCSVDVILTFFVEFFTKRLVNLPTQIFKALPYSLLNKTIATLACNLLLHELYKKSLSLSIDAGTDTSVILYDALKIEGVRAADQTIVGGTLRVASASTVDDYFSCNNHNESRLGMNAEPDLSSQVAILDAVGGICQSV